jgi:hypothetical protein
LTDGISKNLPGAEQCQLYVWIFLNKKGLVETFRRCGKENARSNFDHFVQGFNSASERFAIIDVGYGKEAVDAKLRGTDFTSIQISLFSPLSIQYS